VLPKTLRGRPRLKRAHWEADLLPIMLWEQVQAMKIAFAIEAQLGASSGGVA